MNASRIGMLVILVCMAFGDVECRAQATEPAQNRGNANENKAADTKDDTWINMSHLLTVAVALVGWYITHWLNTQRDQSNHNRRIRTDFLINAFQKLANASQRAPAPGSPFFRDMESAVADIQLLGSKPQIQMVESFTDDFNKRRLAPLDPLLKSLRNDLRKDLGIDPIKTNVTCFRPEGILIDAQQCDELENRPLAISAELIELSKSSIYCCASLNHREQFIAAPAPADHLPIAVSARLDA